MIKFVQELGLQKGSNQIEGSSWRFTSEHNKDKPEIFFQSNLKYFQSINKIKFYSHIISVKIIAMVMQDLYKEHVVIF